MSGSSYVTGSTLAPAIEGQFTSPPAIESMPMQGSGTVYGGSLPTNGTTGLQVVNDRVLKPGEMIAPADSLKVGQK
jgi:hypothetical protein